MIVYGAIYFFSCKVGVSQINFTYRVAEEFFDVWRLAEKVYAMVSRSNAEAAREAEASNKKRRRANSDSDDAETPK